jgi:hypothetical protein
MSGELGRIDVPVLRWEQPKWTQRFHRLTGGETTYATLEWPQAFGSTAVSSSREGRYTFKRGGFLRPFVTVRRQGSEVDLGRLGLDWKGNGELVLNNVQRFGFVRQSIMGFDYEVTGKDGTRLFSSRKEWAPIKHGGEVHITPAGMADRDIGMLITLCWYVAVMASEDVMVGTAAGA